MKITRKESATIIKIVKRAEDAGWVQGHRAPDHWYTPCTMIIDLQECHKRNMPLDFERLLGADDFNFLHDVSGIARHMNRDTGMLENCFRPRFAKRAVA